VNKLIKTSPGPPFTNSILVSTYNTQDLFFAVGISPDNEKIVRIFLPASTREKLFKQISNEFTDFELTEKYNSFAREMFKIYDGQEVSFNPDVLELSRNKKEPLKGPVPNEFDLKVLKIVLKIPKGEVRTYKEVAESMDSRAWRAVGSAMARNPFPLVIPCHRVVKSDLSLGNYGGGVEMKKQLLKKEGVKIKGQNVIRP
jgi:methylated-DNA-[protein]-cysteine S-methyltransferase